MECNCDARETGANWPKILAILSFTHRVHRRRNKTELHKTADGRKSLKIFPRSLIETDKPNDERKKCRVDLCELRSMHCAWS